ncbi:MAG: spoIIIJ-associated protein [Candidatus Peregrinibacteria bacterium Gr01-1014_25]|nr:MAG: spoIIIJ-associated protein [Candidatus Peregrinibacteria bacterium Gr01-1014_25]
MDHELIQQQLAALMQHLGLPYDGCTVTPEGDVLRIDIASTEPSRIIGWHGETLSSLQHLLKAMLRTAGKAPVFLVLDVDGYRRSQEEKVRRIAEQKAEFVRRTGSRIALQPMSPYFRRVVHTFVANSPALGDMTTESVGQGDFRQVVLKLKDEKVSAGEELTPVMAQDDDLGNLDV